MKSNSIEVRPIAGAIGAEIHGIDLADSPSDEQFDTVRRAFLDHQVIFFRDQALDPDSHKELGRRFGELNIHGYYKSLPGHPEILPVLKEPEATENIGGVWHSDVTYLPEPALGSILYALEVPPAGGDTMFASQYHAYEALSDGMKEMLEGLRAIHSSDLFTNKARRDAANATRTTKLAEIDETVESSHPVVRTHPGNRPQVPVRQWGVHTADRRLDGGGKPAAARLSLPAGGASGVHLPVPLAAGVDRILGQSLHPALRAQRLPGLSPDHAPGDAGRGQAGLMELVDLSRELHHRTAHHPSIRRWS